MGRMVMSVRPSVQLSVRQFSTLSSYMLSHIELKFCIWLCFTVLQIKSLIFVNFRWSYALLELWILEIHSFPHFSLICFNILSWNFAYDFFFTVLHITLECHQFVSILWELCPFWNLEYLIASFLHLFRTCIDILSCNFAYDLVLLYYRSSLSFVNLHWFL